MKPNDTNAIDKHVGSRVRMRRMMLGMSQEKLAIPLGITWQQLQKNEKGANRIAASRLQHLSQILQVPVSFFFDGAPTAKINGVTPTDLSGEPPINTAFFAVPYSSDLARAFVKITDTGKRRALIDVANALSRP